MDGKFGIVTSGDTGGVHMVLGLLLNNGGGLFNEKREPTFNSHRNRQALEFFSHLVRDGSVRPASVGYNSDDRRGAFLRGQAAFLLDGPGFVGSAEADVRSQFGILAPLADPQGDKGALFWVKNITVFQQTKHPEETKTFLK